MRRIVLASTSPYRRALLARLGLPFDAAAPHVDEARRDGEPASALVRRLAEAKARAAAPAHPDALIIGSDQVAVLDDQVLGKPGGFDANVEQLTRAAGRRVEFLTGLCLLDAASGLAQVDVVPYAVEFRDLERRRIEAYVRHEQAYDCAGGFKSEGLGNALFARMEGEDPSALIGLPLIRLVGMLEVAGVDVLGAV